MFSFEYKRIFAIFVDQKVRVRDGNVSSSGMTDKTMGKFHSVTAFVRLIFNKRRSRKDYGINARHLMENKKLFTSCVSREANAKTLAHVLHIEDVYTVRLYKTAPTLATLFRSLAATLLLLLCGWCY